METWRRLLADAVTTADELAGRLGIEDEQLAPVIRRYPMRITPGYLRLVEAPGDPIWRQCIPDPAELCDDQQADPLHEERLSPVPGLIHRYPDRVVWVVSGECAVYCRFCMRKRQVGCMVSRHSEDPFSEPLRYISETPAIRDVILSGGDPLLLDDEQLEEILARLAAIPHVEMVRIGTRTPVTLPERITARLCRMLKRYHPLYVNTHFNHPREVTAEAAKACARLADAGIPLGNQSVLLAGVNDDPAVMTRLMQLLLSIRVRPYYIHQMDLVRGTGHFRTPVATGLEILTALRGNTSGMATPHYVIDGPGGKGKIPLLPDCVSRRGDLWLLRTYTGETIEYRDVGQPATVLPG